MKVPPIIMNSTYALGGSAKEGGGRESRERRGRLLYRRNDLGIVIVRLDLSIARMDRNVLE